MCMCVCMYVCVRSPVTGYIIMYHRLVATSLHTFAVNKTFYIHAVIGVDIMQTITSGNVSVTEATNYYINLAE